MSNTKVGALAKKPRQISSNYSINNEICMDQHVGCHQPDTDHNFTHEQICAKCSNLRKVTSLEFPYEIPIKSNRFIHCLCRCFLDIYIYRQTHTAPETTANGNNNSNIPFIMCVVYRVLIRVGFEQIVGHVYSNHIESIS